MSGRRGCDGLLVCLRDGWRSPLALQCEVSVDSGRIGAIPRRHSGSDASSQAITDPPWTLRLVTRFWPGDSWYWGSGIDPSIISSDYRFVGGAGDSAFASVLPANIDGVFRFLAKGLALHGVQPLHVRLTVIDGERRFVDYLNTKSHKLVTTITSGFYSFDGNEAVVRWMGPAVIMAVTRQKITHLALNPSVMLGLRKIGRYQVRLVRVFGAFGVSAGRGARPASSESCVCCAASDGLS